MKPAPLFPPQEKDDLSTHGHRQLIGWAGMLLPLLVWVMSAWRPTAGVDRWTPLESISAYYYTGADEVLVGTLVALAAFLVTYRGYNNPSYRLDRAAAAIASVAALGVAFFPTKAPAPLAEPSWWTSQMRTAHYVSAIALFGAFAFFALFLFPKRSDEAVTRGDVVPRDKRVRNVVYKSCGVAILLSMAWSGIAGALHASIFLPESITLVSFATAWLVKGRARWTVVNLGKKTWHYGRNPGQLVDAARSIGRRS